MHNTLKLTALTVALCSSLSAFAQQAEGNWMVIAQALINRGLTSSPRTWPPNWC